jgi:hypothetical protein
MVKWSEISLNDLVVLDDDATTVTWQGHGALRMAGGLALWPGEPVGNVSIQVSVGADGPCYAGVAFHAADVANYELAYAQPHTSGRWDALQYDPVFHRSNTWQIYHGPSYQATTTVPTGRWFRLRVDTCGARAAISVDGQAPLVVEQLARGAEAGRLGLWAYRPAHFRDLRVAPCTGLGAAEGITPSMPAGTIDAWFVENHGIVTVEFNGTLNLNRYLPLMVEKARLTRGFELPDEAQVDLDFGFSDELMLELDGEEIFAGTTTWSPTQEWADRGYVAHGSHTIRHRLVPGRHVLAAALRVTEGFGWGLTMTVNATGIRWLPVDLG